MWQKKVKKTSKGEKWHWLYLHSGALKKRNFIVMLYLVEMYKYQLLLSIRCPKLIKCSFRKPFHNLQLQCQQIGTKLCSDLWDSSVDVTHFTSIQKKKIICSDCPGPFQGTVENKLKDQPLPIDKHKKLLNMQTWRVSLFQCLVLLL